MSIVPNSMESIPLTLYIFKGRIEGTSFRLKANATIGLLRGCYN